MADPDPTLDRRTVWLDMTRGPVFARCVGNPEHELLLYIHASGPQNGSISWNELVSSIADRAPGMPLYHVAIDCPGYGQSPGDRGAIRDHPVDVLQAVLQALGRRQALALIGSSQGACSILTALCTNPHLCRYVAMRRPLGRNSEFSRFGQIKQPVLMLAEKEDLGHPVKAANQMCKLLPNAHIIEFSSRTHPNWLSENAAAEILAHLARPSKVPPAPAVPDKLAMRRAGGLGDWAGPLGPAHWIRSAVSASPVFNDAAEVGVSHVP